MAPKLRGQRERAQVPVPGREDVREQGLPVLDPGHPALTRAAQWIIDEQVHTPGDWRVRRPDLAPGGWSFAFDNDVYRDVDDTAEALLALGRTAHPAASAAITACLGCGSA